MVFGKSSKKKPSPLIAPSSLGESDHPVLTNPDGSTIDVDDNTLLTVMDKEHILTNMRNRFSRDCIYTYTASVLLSVNPWKIIPNMYTPEMQILYTNRSMHSLPPHPYALADTAYRYFQGDTKSQVMVISGESGSGKTETAKTVISFLASHKERRKAKMGSESPVSDVEALASSVVHDRVIFATPILEAFGNASTIRNKNSSRFGKYHRLLYDKSGRLCGADIKPFLLESSRVTSVSSHERNFHIFYQIFAGMSETDLKRYKLSRSGKYPLVSNGAKQDQAHVTEDKDKYAELMNSFQVVGFSKNECEKIFEIIAGLLILSSVEFIDTSEASNSEQTGGTDSSASAPCMVADMTVLENAASLLGVETAALNKILLYKVSKIANRNSTYLVPRSIGQIESTRATLIRTIYKRLFERIVERINGLVREGTATGGFVAATNDLHIGILDIFGFENLEKNSFEQLCINLTNEKLQQFFIRKVLESEQRIYAAEGIPTSAASNIPLPDCSETLGCIKGALELLDDHCIRLCRNLATDEEKFVAQIHRQFYADRPDSKLIAPKFAKATKGEGGKVGSTPRSKQDGFIIRHYAGDVLYTVGGWLDKNNERMSPEMESLLRDSSSDWMSSLCDKEACSYACEKFKSVRSKFMTELDAMLAMLDKCYVHYIRCFNPNTNQRSGHFDTAHVTDQVVQCGTVELVKVMHYGFPNRQPLQLIADNYQSLLPHDFRSLTPRDFVSVIMSAFDVPAAEFAVGFTTLFLKADQIRLLEQIRGVGEIPSAELLSKIRRQVVIRKFKRCANAVRIVLWFPKMLKDIRRKKLFSLGANLACTIAFILPRIRTQLTNAREQIAERKRIEAAATAAEAARIKALLEEEEARLRQQAAAEEEERLVKRQMAEALKARMGKENTTTVNNLQQTPGGLSYGQTLKNFGSLATLPPVTAMMASNISLFSIPQLQVLIIYDGQKLMPITTNEAEAVNPKSRRSSLGTSLPSVLPPGLRTSIVGAIAQHPLRKDVFATSEVEEQGAVTIWRAHKGVESRFRIHLGGGTANAPQSTVIKKICFIAPDSPNTKSVLYTTASHLLAVLVECTVAGSQAAQYLIFVEVAIGSGSSRKNSSEGTGENAAPQFKVHKVEPIPPPASVIPPNARVINFVKTSASGRVVAVGGKGILMFFVVGMENGNIQVDLLAEQTYFPQIVTMNFLSFMSLYPRDGYSASPDDFEEEQMIVSTADGNMLRFPVLVNQVTCALDISGCGKLKECMATLSGKRLTSLVKRSDEAFYSITADGCIDQWVWADRRPYRDQDSSIALVSENSKAMFSTASMLNREVACLDAHVGKIVAFDPSDPDSLNPRLLYQFNSSGVLN